MPTYLFLFISAIYFAAMPNSSQDKLILFINESNPKIEQKHINKISKLAEELNVELIKINVENGAPKEVTTTPSIFFQNENGRSRYYGRYTNSSRIKNFIRTSKLAHKKEGKTRVEHVLRWESERAELIVPVKITELTGEVPNEYEQEKFFHKAVKALDVGMKEFELEEVYQSPKSAKTFYINIYPFLSASKNLCLTAEIFSQYNCIKPIFTKTDTTISEGSWDTFSKVFAEAGETLQTEILRQIDESKIGDAFSPISNNINIKSWESLDLTIKSSIDSRSEEITMNDFSFGKKWKVKKRSNIDEPIIIFSFLSPVDNYAGEVKALTGTLELDNIPSMNGAKGIFKVDISDVTMGSEDFDYEVHNKMLNMSIFPDASFEFTSITGADGNLEIGKIDNMDVQGKFGMLGINTNVYVDTQIQPIVDDNELLLKVNCTFQLPLFEKFKVEGPDGPSPAKDILQFYMQFYMEQVN